MSIINLVAQKKHEEVVTFIIFENENISHQGDVHQYYRKHLFCWHGKFFNAI